MQKFLEATGENRDAAVENALKQLGLERDDVSVEVLEIGKKGFLGIGATPARASPLPRLSRSRRSLLSRQKSRLRSKRNPLRSRRSCPSPRMITRRVW